MDAPEQIGKCMYVYKKINTPSTVASVVSSSQHVNLLNPYQNQFAFVYVCARMSVSTVYQKVFRQSIYFFAEAIPLNKNRNPLILR